MGSVADGTDPSVDYAAATTTPSINSYELFAVAGDGVTADMIVWRIYKRPAYGIVEAMLDANPHLAVIHQTTPILPPGTLVRVPISNALLTAVQAGAAPNIWG